MPPAPVDRAEAVTRFLDVVPHQLYPFQEEAILAWAECEGGLMVTAPTGMGKTIVAEAAVFEALSTGKRIYYTTPLIALTDQKYHELQDRAEKWGFPRESVGLITGNRRENPNAVVRVVVAEILLNHLLSKQERFDDVGSVVMDEFHWFNDEDRGAVWELALVLMPEHVRVLLLSATVGNPVEFTLWLGERNKRPLRLVRTEQRRVPLHFTWVSDEFLTDHLESMVSDDDARNRVPALVFSFSRDECWELAERLKGLRLATADQRQRAETRMDELLSPAEWKQGAGPKLRQMLGRGVGVHHAGILPKFKDVVETLFLEKLLPFVACTETLAAGVNLPARSVVLTTLLHGKPGSRKLISSASAHQMFGRAGRPQFDTEGFVFAMAHEDDVRIAKWRKRMEQLDAAGKDPNVLRMRKDLERKKPARRTTEQYWSEGQLKSLVAAGPAKLASRGMIPYRMLLWLLQRTDDLREVRGFLSRRFAPAEQIEKWTRQLDAMVANLEKLGHLTRVEGDIERVQVGAEVDKLLLFRSVEPPYAAFLARELVFANLYEKVQALESVLDLPWQVAKRGGLPTVEPGPLQREKLEPMMTAMGIALTRPEPTPEELERARMFAPDEDPDERERPPTFPEMLKIAFEAELAFPEDIPVQPKWIAGGVLSESGDFFKYISSRDLQKNEGLVLRHLLRLVVTAQEFHERTEDPDYEEIGRRLTAVTRQVDARYTDRFLGAAERTAFL
ncbi:MAG: DEAD/DEAH box helicase [Planctomycetes bacterium]|nr:DEAD/DEAH box helicase [Planctomycetota bacterium]